jgi:hypothetical protein
MQTNLKKNLLLGVVAVLMLGLGLGMGDASWAKDTKRVTRVLVIGNFEFLLQPGEWHGFVLGPASVNRGYVVEVTPLDPAEGGAYITSQVQRESDGSAWNDVLRIQLLASTTAVDTQIRVYALVP